MLRPFKSFFSNLQKNAIGAKFFGISPQMINNPEEEKEEEEEEEINDSSIMYNSENMDPLADPLALDDELLNASENGSDFPSVNTTLTDLDSSDDGQIILVDVNSLKNAFTFPVVSYATSSLTSSPRTTNSLDSSGVGGCDENVQSENDNLIRTINYDVNKLENTIVLGSTENVQSVTSISDNMDTNFKPITLTLGDEVIEEVEGVRSDGSDSGLGLELNASLAVNRTIISASGTKTNLKRHSDTCDGIGHTVAKKAKRNIQFNNVTVYYFPRIQGFTCIPSQGGCTLGMGSIHYDEKTFTLAEHFAEQKRLHRQQILELGPKNSSPAPTMTPPTQLGTTEERTSSEDSDSEEELLSDNSGDTETNGFLQPVPQKQRRVLLKAAGVQKIVSYEKNECRDIRSSREFCGCNCRGYCDPDTCYCSQSGIKCQVDRDSFPCGCTQDTCGNVSGRIEFNPKRVRTHFIHTIMRLELEKKQSKSDNQIASDSYDGRLPSESQQATIDCNSSNNNVFSSGSVDVVDNQQDHQCNSNYNNSISNFSCTSSIAKPPLDLHYAFRNDYQTDLPTQLTTIQQTYDDPKQNEQQLPHQQDSKQLQQNYTIYNNSDYLLNVNSNYDNFNTTNSVSQELGNYSNYSNGDPFLVSEANDTMCLNAIEVSPSCSNHLTSLTDNISGTSLSINPTVIDTSSAFTSNSQEFTTKSTEPNSYSIHQYFNSNTNVNNNNNNINIINNSKIGKNNNTSNGNSLVKTSIVYERTLTDLDTNYMEPIQNGVLANNHISTDETSTSVPLLMESKSLQYNESANANSDLNHSNDIKNIDAKQSALNGSSNGGVSSSSHEQCKNDEISLKNNSNLFFSTGASVTNSVSISNGENITATETISA